MATIHEWPLAVGKEIVVLFNDYGTPKTLWRGEQAATFKGGVRNILKLWVEYRYQKPPGGIARYRVIIKRENSTGWTEVEKDEVIIVQEPIDEEVHGLRREYNLLVPGPWFPREDIIFHFRICTEIEKYCSGEWSEDKKDYTATFKKPPVKLVEGYVYSIKEGLDQELGVYRREMRDRRSKRSKGRRTK